MVSVTANVDVWMCGCMDVWMCGYMDVRHVHMYAFVCKYEYMQTYVLIKVLHLYIYNLV